MSLDSVKKWANIVKRWKLKRGMDHLADSTAKLRQVGKVGWLVVLCLTAL